MGNLIYPWFKREDVDGFFALFQNNLANFFIISTVMLGQGFPTSIVFGRVIPGAAIAVIFGNIYYAYMAKRLAQKEGRTDVTALSYGISTPPMFIFLFAVLGAALAATDGDHERAWQIGVAACLLGGIIEVLGSIIGPWVRNNLPRAAMVGALAGVAISFIGGELFFQTFEMPIVGSIVLAIIVIGLVGRHAMPFKLPASLLAIVIGTVLAYVLGRADPAGISEGFTHFGFYFPLPTIAGFTGFAEMIGVGVLAAVIPISLYNFIETMNNVEAVAGLGDDYNVRECQLVDGAGTILGALFGGVFPTTVYIASTGAKEMKAGRGYSVLNGAAFLLFAIFGVIAVIAQIIPGPVIAPILVYVGIVMVGKAFVTSPERHSPAVALAMFPYLANYLTTNFRGLDPETFMAEYPAVEALGQGAMFTALVWGAFAVFGIDRDWLRGTAISFTAFILTGIGVMHAPRLGFNFGSEFAIGYLILTIGMFFMYQYFGKETPQEVEKAGKSD